MVPAEGVVYSVVSAACSTSGVTGGIRLNVDATNGHIASIYNYPSSTPANQGHCLPGGSSQTWGISVRFSLSNMPSGSSGYYLVGFVHVGDSGPSIGYYNGASATNFILYFDAANIVDLGVPLSSGGVGSVHTFRMYRKSVAGTYKTYATFDDVSVISDSTTGFPTADGACYAYCATTENVAKAAEVYHVLCMAEAV